MPYITNVFKWVAESATKCSIVPARLDVWEVDHYSDKYVVNLNKNTCICFKWELNGIPCADAWACIIKKRERPEAYVHECYTKSTYLKAYTPSIKPLRGVKQWERSDMVQPLPPLMRKMPGRPSLKKRKKEQGEVKDSGAIKRPKRVFKCSKCGQTGHYATKCKNPLAPTPRD
ncbi:uncharacterized protein LOC110740211 [Chenopodium quinoa]|uniref:uncharacterized protein LOC110740211 n=1 Tax=Chenopodium quinoa TaxID=63459 RepID=UPI000B780E73|nr:uncharacterized protein LOC110740211 [Chenopodium quinoa]